MSMKKIFSVVCAVSASAALFAGVPTLPSYQSTDRLATQSKHSVENLSNVKSAGKIVMDDAAVATYGVRAPKALLKDTTIELLSSYSVYYPEAFYTGISALGYVSPANLYIPYNPKGALFLTDYTKGTWTLEGKEVAKDTAYIVVPTGKELNKYSVPTLKSNDFTQGDTTLTFAEYQFGSYFNSWYKFSSQLDQATGWAYMTKCEITTNVKIDPYDGKSETYGNNWGRPLARYSATEAGPMYGSGVKLTFSESVGSVLFDTIITTIDNSDVIAIEGANLGIFGINYAEGKYVTPVVAGLHLTLYPLSYVKDEKGNTLIKIDWSNPYATAVATDDDYTPYATSQGTSDILGMLNFTFKEKDADTGVEEATIVTIDGNFAAVLTGLNTTVGDKTNNFGIMADGDIEAPMNANTYMAGVSNLGKSVFSSIWNSPLNLLMNFAAVFPAIVDTPEEVELSVKGDTKEITLNTNVQFDLMDFDFNDWISIDGEDITITENNEEYFNNQVVLKITAPANSTAREGKIIINALGKEYSIAVKQVETTGIDNVKFLNDGKTYNLLGIEVDENYKGVVIRNGEKFIQ